MLESACNKVAGLQTLLKGSNTGVSCEYCEIFKSTYFEEDQRTAASNLNSDADKMKLEKTTNSNI